MTKRKQIQTVIFFAALIGFIAYAVWPLPTYWALCTDSYEARDGTVTVATYEVRRKTWPRLFYWIDCARGDEVLPPLPKKGTEP